MALFNFDSSQVITTHFIEPELREIKTAVDDPTIATYGTNEGAISFVGSDGANFSAEELSNQFVIFQLANKKNVPTILESSQVEPSINGSPEEPDMLVNLEMLNFNLGRNENIKPDTKATIRITIGKDESSRDKYFETAFWSIAAGLSLYNTSKKGKSDSKELKSDFRKAFNNRPIEIPGGLSKMSFEVVKHQEPKWWQRIFKFLQSGTGQSLVSTIGFPAITTSAITVIDELLNRLDNDEPEVLFKSMPLRLALSKQAKEDFTSGYETIKMGCLNPGFAILARAKDFTKIVQTEAFYYPTVGKLVPAHVSEAQLMTGKYEDPFEEITYSVFKIGMKSTKLDPTFNYGG